MRQKEILPDRDLTRTTLSQPLLPDPPCPSRADSNSTNTHIHTHLAPSPHHTYAVHLHTTRMPCTLTTLPSPSQPSITKPPDPITRLPAAPHPCLATHPDPFLPQTGIKVNHVKPNSPHTTHPTQAAKLKSGWLR